MALIANTGMPAKKLYTFNMHEQAGTSFGISGAYFNNNDIVEYSGTTASATPSLTLGGVTISGSRSGNNYIYSITGFTGAIHYKSNSVDTVINVSDPSTPTSVTIDIYTDTSTIALVSD